MESLRKALIRWNIAPLLQASLLCGLTCYLVYLLGDAPKDLAGMPDGVIIAIYGALATLVGTMCGLIYKMYDSLQKDRHVEKDDETE